MLNEQHPHQSPSPQAGEGMQITLRYFASIREAVDSTGEQLTTRAPTLAALRDELIARGTPWDQALARGRNLRMALNQMMVNDEATPLLNHAEVAFFPPVTGGVR